MGDAFMKCVNIYELTRISDKGMIQRLERQSSGRTRYLSIKSWEIKSLKKLVNHMIELKMDVLLLQFFYSFQIPKLGKEFDLLKIDDETVINIELKSGVVPQESIRKQLIQNRYYLSSLGKTIRSYTYISSTDQLVRLTKSNHVVETDWETICTDIIKQKDCYCSDIEDLFKADQFIISPLVEPNRFLQKEYFLTSQQRDISNKILKNIKQRNTWFQGFTGMPGTGKTLLLYDIAMHLSKSQKICIIHCGSFSKELEQLNFRLKRIEFMKEHNIIEKNITDYAAILVDEAHNMSKGVFEKLYDSLKEKNIPVIFSYDCEDVIAEKEIEFDIVKYIRKCRGYEEYRLTNRIRTNEELSAFIQCLLQGSSYNHRKAYPSVAISYANNIEEMQILLEAYQKQEYTFICDKQLHEISVLKGEYTEIFCAKGHEYDKVVMIIDKHFYFDEKHLLRYSANDSDMISPVRNLFHGLNRAKEKIALIIIDNESVLETILTIIQGLAR